MLRPALTKSQALHLSLGMRALERGTMRVGVWSTLRVEEIQVCLMDLSVAKA